MSSKALAEAIVAYQDRHGSGADPIEAGFIGNLADNECRHGALPSDQKLSCKCFEPKDGKR